MCEAKQEFFAKKLDKQTFSGYNSNINHFLIQRYLLKKEYLVLLFSIWLFCSSNSAELSYDTKSKFICQHFFKTFLKNF